MKFYRCYLTFLDIALRNDFGFKDTFGDDDDDDISDFCQNLCNMQDIPQLGGGEM